MLVPTLYDCTDYLHHHILQVSLCVNCIQAIVVAIAIEATQQLNTRSVVAIAIQTKTQLNTCTNMALAAWYGFMLLVVPQRNELLILFYTV